MPHDFTPTNVTLFPTRTTSSAGEVEEVRTLFVTELEGVRHTVEYLLGDACDVALL